MFELFQENLLKVFSRLKNYGRLTPEIINETLREIRRALLQADVNFKVSKEFEERVREKALGKQVTESLTPAQEVIKIVRDELVEILGSENREPDFASVKRPVKILLIGLQGSGKTTTAIKLALYLKKEKGFLKPVVVACDVERPAAILQLEQLGKSAGIEVFKGNGEDFLEIAEKAIINFANSDALIFDSQGRLHIDEDMLDQLKDLSLMIKPEFKFLVIDAMTGQEAVNVALAFDEKVGVDGLILTKLDGDARGGAALSATKVTGKPVLYIGTGERPDELSLFHPDRVANRILGMGDVLSLIEKAEKELDVKRAEEAQQKLLKGEFTLVDFLEQMREMKKLGGIKEILQMFPAEAVKEVSGILDEKDIKSTEAIILSMTPEERVNPIILNGSRKSRIAKGSGTSIQKVNQLLKSFFESKKLMKSLKKLPNKRFKVKFPFIR